MSTTHPVAGVRVGTRGSALALAQADMTEAALAGAWPGIDLERDVIRTVGDKRPDLRLADFASGPDAVVDKGIFTKELEQALEAGRIDLAVHSLKDVPTELADGFAITAVLPRAPIEDVLLSKHPGGLEGLPEDARVATSSVRRRALLGHLRPDLRVEEIRGNVPTRIEKLAASETTDAIILARAGLVRLGILDAGDHAASIAAGGGTVAATVLDPFRFLPAAGQGAVGIETYRAGEGLAAALEGINDRDTHLRVRAERHFLHLLEAGCQTPVGVHTIMRDGTLEFRAVVFREGELDLPPRQTRAAGACGEPEEVAAEAFARLGP